MHEKHLIPYVSKLSKHYSRKKKTSAKQGFSATRSEAREIKISKKISLAHLCNILVHGHSSYLLLNDSKAVDLTSKLGPVGSVVHLRGERERMKNGRRTERPNLRGPLVTYFFLTSSTPVSKMINSSVKY